MPSGINVQSRVFLSYFSSAEAGDRDCRITWRNGLAGHGAPSLAEERSQTMVPTSKRQVRTRAAFTLIEVMIVIAIILALSGLVGVAVFQQRERAKYQMAEIELKSIQQAMKHFRLAYDRWPTEEEGIAVLWDKEILDQEADQTAWTKLLDSPMPEDKWGNEWGYRPISENGDESMFDLWSNGPDGEEGTEDDITSWSLEEDGEGGFENFSGEP